MNKPTEDPVFDALLEEMLTKQHPPELTARIVTAWQRERAQQAASHAAARPASPAVVAAKPLRRGVGSRSSTGGTSDVLQATPVDPRVTRPTTVSSEGALGNAASRRRWGVIALSVCAASLLLIAGWRTLWLGGGKAAAQAQAEKKSTDQSGTSAADASAPAPALAEADRTPQGASTALPEVLPIDDLPFSLAESSTVDQPLPHLRTPRTVERLAPQQVVSGLDRRLTQLWDSLAVEPSPRLMRDELARRVSLMLTGEEVPATWLSSRTEPEAPLDTLALATEATGSVAFARRWSQEFVEQWLAGGSIANDSQLLEGLKRSVATRIQRGQAWNRVVDDLLGGELANKDHVVQAVDEPNRIYVAALAGGENHRLVERLGADFLNVNLACVRCHDAAPQATEPMQRQETYWSLVALLKGIDARGNADRGERVVIDRQAELFTAGKRPTVFFDLPNGVLKAAEPRLPDGGAVAVEPGVNLAPRQLLAQWITASSLYDQAAVNHAWKLVFGRYLVPQNVEIESVGLRERAETLQFLAEQFRANDHDLRQLLSWIVSSEAFARQPLSLSKAQWLEASEEQLVNYQMSELVFATGPALGRSPESQSLESSLAAVVNWNGGDIASSTMLAQPVPVDVSKSPNKAPAELASLPSLSFAIHGERFTLQQQAFINRLLKSDRLSWEDRVEHVVGLAGRFRVNGRVQQLAKELLEQNSGNAHTALLDLLWAVQNADAG